MPVYEYKAYAPGGATRTGVIDADTPREARQRLRRDNLLVSDLKPVRGRAGKGKGKPAVKAKRPSRSKGANGAASVVDDGRPEVVLPPKDGWWARLMDARARSSGGPRGRDLELVAAITRQMGTLLGAGIPLAETLRAVIDQSETKRIETLFRQVREAITQGASLGDALSVHPSLFTPLYVNMVKAGEATGQVDNVLSRLADFLQSQRAIQRKVVSALTYPAMMIGLGIIVVSILMTVVVPKITGMLEDMDQELPAPTKILIAVSEGFQQYWWVGGLAIAAAAYGVERWYKTKGGRITIDRFVLKVPLIGELLRKRSVSRFCRTLSTLLSSGVAAVPALEITASVVGNQVIANATDEVRIKILEGTDFASPLKATGVFPPVVGYMVSVGEQSGELETMLDRIADAFDEEIEVTTERVTTVLEPIMIVFLAVVVGYIVISIILPILQVGAISQ